VLMAACDTFRAGAVEQLEQWADRAECDIVGPCETAKTPAAVLYKALDQALQSVSPRTGKPYDTVLVDTSGRLSNNDALTAELAKMKRVIRKRMSSSDEGEDDEEVPHETLLVLDAAQGRMALDSARTWNNEIGLTGLILTKLDGSAKGGSVVSISRDLQLPVKLIGVGEGIEDLRDVSFCAVGFELSSSLFRSNCVLRPTLPYLAILFQKHVNFFCKFDRERFVDGLLGIGDGSIAGGSSSSSSSRYGSSSGSKKGEGQVLAARLAEMRKERDDRASAKNQQQQQQAQQLAAVGGGGGAGAAAAPTAPNTGAPSRSQKPNRPKNKKKKKGRK